MGISMLILNILFFLASPLPYKREFSQKGAVKKLFSYLGSRFYSILRLLIRLILLISVSAFVFMNLLDQFDRGNDAIERKIQSLRTKVESADKSLNLSKTTTSKLKEILSGSEVYSGRANKISLEYTLVTADNATVFRAHVIASLSKQQAPTEANGVCYRIDDNLATDEKSPPLSSFLADSCSVDLVSFTRHDYSIGFLPLVFYSIEFPAPVNTIVTEIAQSLHFLDGKTNASFKKKNIDRLGVLIEPYLQDGANLPSAKSSEAENNEVDLRELATWNVSDQYRPGSPHFI